MEISLTNPLNLGYYQCSTEKQTTDKPSVSSDAAFLRYFFAQRKPPSSLWERISASDDVIAKITLSLSSVAFRWNSCIINLGFASAILFPPKRERVLQLEDKRMSTHDTQATSVAKNYHSVIVAEPTGKKGAYALKIKPSKRPKPEININPTLLRLNAAKQAVIDAKAQLKRLEKQKLTKSQRQQLNQAEIELRVSVGMEK